MSDWQEQPDWWQASDGRWYPPPRDPQTPPPGNPGYPPPPGPGAQGWGPPPGPYQDWGPPPDPGAPPGMYFDRVSGLVLPEGVELASIGRRVASFFLSIVLLIVTLGIGYLIWGLILWQGGRTPAFQVLGMRCWRPETERVAGFWWMALREIGGRILLDITAIIAVVSFILMLITRRRQALHDVIAGTVVVIDPRGVLRTG